MYFSHDTDARNEDKMLGVRMELGAEGYGMYWMLLEKLAAEKTHILTLDMAKLAWDLRCDTDKLSRLINNYGLFVLDEENRQFWSEGLMARMEKADAVSGVRSEAGKASAEARRRKANALKLSKAENDEPTNAEQTRNKCSTKDEQNDVLLEQKSNKQNKIKGKEIKENIIKEKSSSSKPSSAEAVDDEDEAAGAAEEEDEEKDLGYDPFELHDKAIALTGAIRFPPGTTREEWERIARAMSARNEEDRKKVYRIVNELFQQGASPRRVIYHLTAMDAERPINDLSEDMWAAITAVMGLATADIRMVKATVGRNRERWRDLALAVKEATGNKKITQPGRFILSRIKA